MVVVVAPVVVVSAVVELVVSAEVDVAPVDVVDLVVVVGLPDEDARGGPHAPVVRGRAPKASM